ncbi:uncharacterized protein LOC114293609 [Camellia sinensis]|uniref:uncharacterized protein LOC114293609 n=1 Tax=Camellia sinensis TaxID=4442 RepID=UPI00103552FF|nr:uncharacterized protein LOC114293609 [Camellia sinensis]
MFYQLPGYTNCHLDNNEELQNMLLLGKSIGVERIDVVVEQKSGTDRHGSLANPCIEDEDQTNLLRRYCAHSEKVLLSSVWANGITHIGQCFIGGAFEFRTILCKYAVQCGFKFKYLKNDSQRSTASPKSNQFFYLKRWTKIHSCGADVRTSKNPRLSSDLVSNVVSERVRDRPLTRPTDVAYTFKADYGLDISYHIAWLGVEKVREAMHCDYLTSFDQLRWYGDAVQRYNPGSHINIDYDLKTSQFKRYKGQLLVATAKDGNQGLFPIAFAIVDSEGESNWSWFLYELSKVIADDRRMTFVSDRNLALLEAMPKAFPSAYHGWCLQHLKNNFRDKLKGMENGFKEHLIRKLGDCAYEPTVTGFHALLEELKSEGKQRAYNFLSRGQRYGEMTSNAAKSFKNWIKEARNLPITKLVDTIRNQIMCQMSERRDIANKWNGIICPTFETNLQDSFNSSRSWNVSKANDDVFEVHSFPSVTVDVGRCVCSCYQWQINGFPYEHAVAAIQRSAYNLNNCVEKYFHVENYREAYAAVIFPIPSVEKPDFCSSDFIILPPIVKRPAGRPRKSRIPSQGEKVSQIRCDRCGKMGRHNRKSCKEPIQSYIG